MLGEETVRRVAAAGVGVGGTGRLVQPLPPLKGLLVGQGRVCARSPERGTIRGGGAGVRGGGEPLWLLLPSSVPRDEAQPSRDSETASTSGEPPEEINFTAKMFDALHPL